MKRTADLAAFGGQIHSTLPQDLRHGGLQLRDVELVVEDCEDLLGKAVGEAQFNQLAQE